MDSKGPPPSAARMSLDVTSVEEEPLLDAPLIQPDLLLSSIHRATHTLPTAWGALPLSLLHVAYVALSSCLAVLCMLGNYRDGCGQLLGSIRGVSVVVWGKVGVWLLEAVFTCWAQRHHRGARKKGYLRFYRDTRRLKYLPLSVCSVGNVAVLVALGLRSSYPEQQNVHVYVLLGILGLELLLVLPCLLVYTVRVVQFNRQQAGPDISQLEWSQPHTHTTASETGFREGSSLEEVVDKQADLIEYLKQHNTFLSRRLLNLTAQH